MYDRDMEMHAYIDEHIIGDRTSDAAEDSSGAAWAAYERGEFQVPKWFSKEYQERTHNPYIQKLVDALKSKSSNKSHLTLDTFLRSMGILFMVLIGLFAVMFMIGFLTT